MAEKTDPVEAGEQVRVAASALPSKSDQPFRLADIVNLAAIVVGLIVAIFTSLGLCEHISELDQRINALEQRVESRVEMLSHRLDSVSDRLSDQIRGIDERLSRIEGDGIKSRERPQ